jgi:hypothetical protein
MFTTGSRAPVYTLIATGPVILGLAAIGRVLDSKTAVRLCVLLPVMTIVALNLSPRAVEGFSERAESASDNTLSRTYTPIYQTLGALSEGPALGMGIGATHPSALSIMGVASPWWLNELLVEDEMARVALELGVIGVFLIYFMRILIAAFALRYAMSFKDPACRALGIALAVYMAVCLIVPIMLNITAGLYYWGSLGLVLAMRRLEQSARTQFGEVLVRGAYQTPNLQPVIPAGTARRRPS